MSVEVAGDTVEAIRGPTAKNPKEADVMMSAVPLTSILHEAVTTTVIKPIIKSRCSATYDTGHPDALSSQAEVCNGPLDAGHSMVLAPASSITLTDLQSTWPPAQ